MAGTRRAKAGDISSESDQHCRALRRVRVLEKGTDMANKVFKQIELTGTSKTSMEDAVQTAIAEAAKTIRHIQWFQVTETRGAIEDGKIAEWQVTLKIGFRIET